MGTIFKAYDIRGIYPEQIDEETICRIGKAYVDVLIGLLKKDDVTIVVGQDMRTSSPSLAENIIRGITEQGVKVVDIGWVSTPTFYHAATILGMDGGMQVSASHNPKEYNGVKIVRGKALPVGYDNGTDLSKTKIFYTYEIARVLLPNVYGHHLSKREVTMFNVFRSKNPSINIESVQSGALNDQNMTKEEELISKNGKSEAIETVNLMESTIKLLKERTKSIIALALTFTIILLFVLSACKSQEPLFTKDEILPILTTIIGVILGYYFAKFEKK